MYVRSIIKKCPICGDIASRVREVNEVNYNKYGELIIRSFGGVILRQMFEEGVTQ